MTELDPRSREALDRMVAGADALEPDWSDVRRRATAIVPAPRRPRRRRFLLALVPVAVIAGGAATVASLRTSAPEALASTGIACAAEPRTDADLTIVDGDGRAPAAVCAALWRRGDVAGPVASVPPLTACDVGTGAIYVFPSGEAGFCARAGFAPVPAGYARLAGRVAALREALVPRLAREHARCAPYGVAAAAVREELDRHGFRRWRVERGGGPAAGRPDPRRPCHGSLALDGGRRTVVVVPEPPVTPPSPAGARVRLVALAGPEGGGDAHRVASDGPRHLDMAWRGDGGACLALTVPAGRADGCVGPALARRAALAYGVLVTRGGRVIFGRAPRERVERLEVSGGGRGRAVRLVGDPYGHFVALLPRGAGRDDAVLVARDGAGRVVATAPLGGGSRPLRLA